MQNMFTSIASALRPIETYRGMPKKAVPAGWIGGVGECRNVCTSLWSLTWHDRVRKVAQKWQRKTKAHRNGPPSCRKEGASHVS
jgi:hypothetical protein